MTLLFSVWFVSFRQIPCVQFEHDSNWNQYSLIDAYYTHRARGGFSSEWLCLFLHEMPLTWLNVIATWMMKKNIFIHRSAVTFAGNSSMHFAGKALSRIHQSEIQNRIGARVRASMPARQPTKRLYIVQNEWYWCIGIRSTGLSQFNIVTLAAHKSITPCYAITSTFVFLFCCCCCFHEIRVAFYLVNKMLHFIAAWPTSSSLKYKYWTLNTKDDTNLKIGSWWEKRLIILQLALLHFHRYHWLLAAILIYLYIYIYMLLLLTLSVMINGSVAC